MKVDIVYLIIPLALLVLILLAYRSKPKQIIVKEIVNERPAPYWTFAYPNYWERPARDNRFYDPYIYPYYTGPWFYGGYSGYGGGGGYSGGIRTGGGHHGGGGGHHGGGGHGGGGGHH